MRFFYRWLFRRTVHHFVPQRDTKMVWQFSFFFVVSLIKWDWKKICWVLILVSGKVQVSLVWNSRNEKSHNADKLQALSSVSFSWFLSLVSLNCSAGFTYFVSHLQFLWRKGGPNCKFHLIHSVWANFQTSTNNVSQRTLFSYAWAKDPKKIQC